MGIHLRKVCAKDKGRCCGRVPTQALQRTKEDATHSGCLAPKKKRKNCKVCEQISNNEKEIAKNKGRCCGLIPTPTRDAARESWTDGLCYRCARLAGLCPNNKIFDDAKKKYVPAPKQSDFDQSELSDESDEENIENRVGPNQYMPRSASGTLDREWEYQKQKPVASSSIPPSTFNPTRLSDLNRMNIASTKNGTNSLTSINAAKYRKPVMADGHDGKQLILSLVSQIIHISKFDF